MQQDKRVIITAKPSDLSRRAERHYRPNPPRLARRVRPSLQTEPSEVVFTAKRRYKSNGFTLIELIVALAIFSIVVVAAVGIFLVILQGQQKALAIETAQENARYIMESMAKEIRMMLYVIKEPPPSNPQRLKIRNAYYTDVIYEFSDGNLKREGAILNSSQVEITGSFRVQGYIKDPFMPKPMTEQTRVTIFMKVKTKGFGPGQQPEINLQTTVSRRAFAK